MAAENGMMEHEMEELIKELQEMKTTQLIRVGWYPTFDTEFGTTGDRGEVSKPKKKSCITKSLKILDCPRKRLLCKLALDVAELDSHIKKQKREKLTKSISTGFMLEDNFLQRFAPTNSLLQSWYKQLQHQISKDSNQEILNISEAKYMKDKIVYNIKYKSLCFKCKGMVGLQTLQTSCKPWQNVAELWFSTCHKGYCSRIKIESDCPKCCKVSCSDEIKGIRIIIDPCIENCEDLLLECLQKPETAMKYILENVRTWVDQITQITAEV